jgi:hypothetical protein
MINLENVKWNIEAEKYNYKIAIGVNLFSRRWFSNEVLEALDVIFRPQKI